MALGRAVGRARASAAGNPITFSYTVAAGDSGLVLLIEVQSATSRAGGAPTWGSQSFTQRNSTQKAAASPEASCELWDLLNPEPGTQTLTIPNTGALTVFHTVDIIRDPNKRKVAFDVANGGNNTSTNPTPGAVVTSGDGALLYGVTAGGWQTWAPSAQVGTALYNSDDGATGAGAQYLQQAVHGSSTLSWTFGTSDDWGAVVAAYLPLPSNVIENYKRAGQAVG